MENSKREKLIIIGSGPAGLLAAIYAARGNLNPLVIAGREAGGQLMLTTDVDDFPGFENGVQGPELMDKMRKQAVRFNTSFVNEDVISVDFSKKPYLIKTETQKLTTQAVIIATGASAMWLGLESEKKLIGKGVSSCAVCVTPDTQIITNPNVKSINSVLEKDKVLTHEGRFQRSIVTGKREYDGELIVIDPAFFHGELKLTPEHEVLAAKRMKGYFYRKFLLRKEYMDNVGDQFSRLGLRPEWIPANNLTAGDFLFYPVISVIKDVGKINLSDFIDCQTGGDYLANHKQTHTSVNIPNVVKVDGDFLRLCGYYISEGSGGKQLDIYFNKNEIDYINDVKILVKKFFGLDVYLKTIGSVTRISCFSKLVGNFFKNVFGGLSSEKHLPQWMLTLPASKQAELFKGVWRGDGSKKKQSFHYVTSSKLLCEQLKSILLRLGVIPSTYIKTVEHQNRIDHKINGRLIIAKSDKYEIEVGGPWLKKLSELLDTTHLLANSRARTNYHGWFQDGYAILPIKSIRKEQYNGLVYNLAVGTDNSYTTTNACVHNCDGFFFKGKNVVVVGGGDTAMREAAYLAKLCNKVTVVHRRNSLRAQPALQELVKSKPNVDFIWNSEVIEVLGQDKVTGVKIKNTQTGDIRQIQIDGVFVAIGHKPNTEFLKGQIDLDEKGYIVIHGETKTSVDGVFFAGDVADKKYKQAVTAAGMGTKAALDVEEYLENLKI